MPQRIDDIGFDVGSDFSPTVIVDDDRKRWPAGEIFPDGCAICAEKVDVETERRCENDVSPSAAYVHQNVPLPDGEAAEFKLSSGASDVIEYCKQELIWKQVNHRPIVHATVTLAYLKVSARPSNREVKGHT